MRSVAVYGSWNSWHLPLQSQQQKHQNKVWNLLKVNNTDFLNDVNDVVLVPLLLNLNRFINSSGVFIANFEQVIFIANFDACWDDNDNNNDYKSHNDVDRTDLMIDLI